MLVDEATACVAFSLFTHLPETTCLDYLREMRRALKPGGIAIFSFFDPSVAAFDRMLKGGWTRRLLRRTLYAPNVGYSPETVADWARRTGFSIVRIESVSAIGQSLAVLGL